RFPRPPADARPETTRRPRRRTPRLYRPPSRSPADVPPPSPRARRLGRCCRTSTRRSSWNPRTTAETPRRFQLRLRISSVALVIQVTEVRAVLQHADGHHSECEYDGPGFQMPAESLVGSCQCDVRVHDAFGDVAAHADYVGRPSGILDEHILR